MTLDKNGIDYGWSSFKEKSDAFLFCTTHIFIYMGLNGKIFGILCAQFNACFCSVKKSMAY